MAFSYTLSKNQSFFPDWVSLTAFWTSFSTTVDLLPLLPPSSSSRISTFWPGGLCFGCFLCVECRPHRWSYSPMSTSCRSLPGSCLLSKASLGSFYWNWALLSLFLCTPLYYSLLYFHYLTVYVFNFSYFLTFSHLLECKRHEGETSFVLLISYPQRFCSKCPINIYWKMIQLLRILSNDSFICLNMFSDRKLTTFLWDTSFNFGVF